MAIIKNPITVVGGGGGDIVNGIIEQYKANTGIIDANTFVEFVNAGAGTDTQLAESFSIASISAVAMDPNKVFVVYRHDNYCYGVVCTIDGTIITIGTSTQLSSGRNSYSDMSVTLVEDGKVFVTHGYGSNYYLYGVVCTVSGTTITVGTAKQISTVTESSNGSSAVLIDTNKVFVSHGAGSGTYTQLYGVVCTVSGTTITVGTAKQLSTVSNSNYDSSTVLIETNKVFVSHTVSSSLNGIVCTISGTTITAGTDTKLISSVGATYGTSAAFVGDDRVFIAYPANYSDRYLYGVVCTVSGTTITVGTAKQLSTVTKSGENASAVAVDTNKVLLLYHGTSDTLYGMVCTISDTTITTGTAKQLSTVTSSYNGAMGALLVPNKVFILHGSASVPYGMVYGTNSYTTVHPSSLTIGGLTKTQCTTSTAGDVCVLNN